MKICDIITEGGAAIPNSQPVTPENFEIIMRNLKKALPNLDFYPIGSAGHKPLSSDVDVLVDQDQVLNQSGADSVKDAKQWLEQQLLDQDLVTRKSGVSVHVGMPWSATKHSQVDIMLVPNAANIAPLHQHDYSQDPTMKGGAVFPMIADLAKLANPDYKYAPWRGLVSRSTDEVISQNKDEIAQLVLDDPTATADSISSPQAILRAVAERPKQRRLFESVGRQNQHLEDLVYIEGSEGALQAVKTLERLSQNPTTMTIKWDGSPAVRFGRDQNGKFHFADKYAREPITSQQALISYFKQKPVGKNVQFVNQMAGLWPVFEKATPLNFRGYVHADLLWSSRPASDNSYLVFTPNTVKYQVDVNSPLGQKISASQVGAAASMWQSSFDSGLEPIGKQWQEIGSNQLVLLGPTVAAAQPVNIDQNQLKQIAQRVMANQNAIDQFVTPQPGLADIKNIIYTFMNQVAKTGNTTRLFSRFVEWIDEWPKLSQGKRDRIRERLNTNAAGAQSMFYAVEQIINLKNQVISQLESPTLNQVGMQATLITGEKGGEGFVDQSGVKLVNRTGFSRANLARER